MNAILRSSMTSLSAGKRNEAEDGGAVNSMTDSVEDCSWPLSTSVLRRRCSASRIPSPHSSSENWLEESCWAPIQCDNDLFFLLAVQRWTEWWTCLIAKQQPSKVELRPWLESGNVVVAVSISAAIVAEGPTTAPDEYPESEADMVHSLYLHSGRGGRTSPCRRRLVNVEILQGEESEKWRLETRERRGKERRFKVRRRKIRDGRLPKEDLEYLDPTNNELEAILLQ